MVSVGGCRRNLQRDLLWRIFGEIRTRKIAPELGCWLCSGDGWPYWPGRERQMTPWTTAETARQWCLALPWSLPATLLSAP